jgi:glycosyltransferase involved in cell wall biosynthesis
MPQSNYPKVVVCIPTYNSSQTIAETLESILSQTYTNIEILIIDNASTDDTVDIINSYALKDNRVELQAYQENIGGEGNFTRCIQLAYGDYTAIYHSDDVYTKTMIEQQVTFLEEYREAGAVFTLANDIDCNSKKIRLRDIPKELYSGNRDVYNFDNIFKMVLKYGNFLICPSAMVRTDIYKKEIAIWDGKSYATSADLDVWLKILKKYLIGIIKEPLMNYRISKYSYSYHYKRSIRGRHDLFLVLDDYINGFAQNRINDTDKNNYKLLVLKDNINRALSHVIRNERKQALDLLQGLFSTTNLKLSIKSSQQFKFLLIGYSTYLLSLLPIGEYGRKKLSDIRFGK